MTNKESFLSICREDIKRDGIEDLLRWLEDSDFFTAPASTRFHGNYEGGLCEHSLNVHRELTRLNDIYQLGYSKETIAVTALFHDLCKVNYYKRGTRNIKDENGKGGLGSTSKQRFTASVAADDNIFEKLNNVPQKQNGAARIEIKANYQKIGATIKGTPYFYLPVCFIDLLVILCYNT